MSRSSWVKLGVFVLFVGSFGGLIWVVREVGVEASVNFVRDQIQRMGVWGPVVYLLAYGQPIIPLPASVMTVGAGAAFGKLWGFIAAFSGAMIRACSEFAVARWLGRDAVEHLLRGKAADLDQKIGENGFKTVLLIRLIPNLPFDIQNYSLGFSRVRFSHYALASLIGMLPASYVYVFLGSSLTEPQHLWKLLLAVCLIIGLAVMQSVLKKKQQTMPVQGEA